MRKISILMTVLASFAVASVASAQQGKGTGTGTGTAATPAKGGGTAGGAVKADAKVDAKVKPADKGAPAPAPTEGAMPTKPTIPTQLTDAAKKQKGTWTCKGDMMGPDGNPAYKTTFTVKAKLDLDNMFIRADMAEKKSKSAKYPFKFTSYTTYTDKDAKWHRFMVDNWGGWATGWSTGPDATGKTVWEMDMSGPMGTSKFRDHEEPAADPKVAKRGGMHMWGEMSMDGKTWVKVYDSTCTK
jgi:hypothetical protein